MVGTNQPDTLHTTARRKMLDAAAREAVTHPHTPHPPPRPRLCPTSVGEDLLEDTVLHALNELASQQAKGTEQTIKAMLHFPNCAATHPDAEKVHKASDMMLAVDSDAAHLVAPMARSRAGGHHCLGNKDGTTTTTHLPPGNQRERVPGNDWRPRFPEDDCGWCCCSPC